MEFKNPFVFDRPNNIDVEEFLKFYIKDNTYTRFLESTRNILLIGVRGSGKTSTLRYYSYPIQIKNPEITNKQSVIGIHIPSKHPLFSKKEYLLYKNDNKKYIVVEHFLCINIISCICDTFNETIESLSLTQEVETEITDNLSFILDAKFEAGKNLFEKLKYYVSKEANQSQKKLNANDFESFIDYSFSFNNTIIPLLEQLKKIITLQQSHFSLFFDDVHDLEDIHQRIINSWISYRDNQLFSFKVATADIKPSYITSTGGVVLEGHDFVKIDLTKRVFSKDSEFSNFARDVVSKRLSTSNITKDISDFFPISETFKKGLEDGNTEAKKIAMSKFPNPVGTQISDYAVKNGRAIFFRRQPKSNLPPYSGFDTIVDISTGVIRNLLTPLFFMYEKELSKTKANIIESIPPNVQSEIIKKSSEDFWNKIRNIDSEIDNCSVELAQAINKFFDHLMIYLKKRLADDKISEPRALNFIISQNNADLDEKIIPIIDACLRSTLLYKRTVNHKDNGTKLALYVPNRLMLPAHGLDPHGQYSHFPISAKSFVEAAYYNKTIPLFNEDENKEQLQIEF